jgi:hypothetical protein
MPATVSIHVSGDSPVEILHSDKDEARTINPGQLWNETLAADDEISIRLAVDPAAGVPDVGEAGGGPD